MLHFSKLLEKVKEAECLGFSLSNWNPTVAAVWSILFSPCNLRDQQILVCFVAVIEIDITHVYLRSSYFPSLHIDVRYP